MEKNNNNDEITLKEIIIYVKDYFAEIKSNWFWLFLFVLPFLVYNLYTHYKDIPKYQSQIHFVVEGSSGVGGGIGGILGSIGIQKGSNLNPYKVLKVGKSGRVLADVIFEGYNDSLSIANEILRVYNPSESWNSESMQFNNYLFRDTLYSDKDLKAFKKIHTLLWGDNAGSTNPIISFNMDDKTGVFNITSNAYTEELSIKITSTLYDKIKYFFEDEIFERQKQTLEILESKLDSIEILKNSKMMQLASFEDSNYGLVSKKSSLRKSILSQEVQALNLAHIEVMKKYEISDITLKDQQPLFIEIDRTLSPLTVIKSNIYRKVILSLLYGIMLAIVFILLRKLYRDIII